MADDIEKRIRTLEDDHKEQRLLYKHMAEAIDDIRDNIRKAIDLKGLVDDHHGQLKKVWIKLDECQKLRGEFDILKAEHLYCKPKVDEICLGKGTFEHRLKDVEDWQAEADRTVKGRVVSVADKAIWIAIIVIAGISVLAMLKGYKP